MRNFAPDFPRKKVSHTIFRFRENAKVPAYVVMTTADYDIYPDKVFYPPRFKNLKFLSAQINVLARERTSGRKGTRNPDISEDQNLEFGTRSTTT